MTEHRCAADDAGESLIEVIIAIVMMGLLFVGVLGALMSSSQLTAGHRDDTRTDIALRAAVEAVKQTEYKAGSGPAQLHYASVAAAAAGSTPSVQVACWPGGLATVDSTTAFASCAAGADKKLQLVTITATTSSASSGTHSETTQFLKRGPS